MTWNVTGTHPTGANIIVGATSAFDALEVEAELIDNGYTNVQIVGG